MTFGFRLPLFFCLLSSLDLGGLIPNTWALCRASAGMIPSISGFHLRCRFSLSLGSRILWWSWNFKWLKVDPLPHAVYGNQEVLEDCWTRTSHKPWMMPTNSEQYVYIYIYIHPGKLTAGTWNSPNWKGKNHLFTKPPWLSASSREFSREKPVRLPPGSVLNPLNSCHGEINSDTTVILASTLLGSTPDCNSPMENADSRRFKVMDIYKNSRSK